MLQRYIYIILSPTIYSSHHHTVNMNEMTCAYKDMTTMTTVYYVARQHVTQMMRDNEREGDAEDTEGDIPEEGGGPFRLILPSSIPRFCKPIIVPFPFSLGPLEVGVIRGSFV